MPASDYLKVFLALLVAATPMQVAGLLAYRALKRWSLGWARACGVLSPALLNVLIFGLLFFLARQRSPGLIPLIDGFAPLIILFFAVAGAVFNLICGAGIQLFLHARARKARLP